MAANLLETGARFLADQNARHMSRTVAYQRGGVSAALLAKAGRSPMEDLTADPVVIRSERREWIVGAAAFAAAALVLGGARVPLEGDRIIETEDGVVRTYEVSAEGADSPYEGQNGFHVELRIRTRRIATT